MNQRADDLGLDTMTYYNVSGLTDSDYGKFSMHNGSEYNVGSAKDVAALG